MNLIFKTYRTATLALLASASLAAALALTPAPQAQAAQQAPTTVRIVLKGMVCAYCAHGLSQRLMRRPDLESVQVRLASRDAILKLKPDSKLSETDMRQVAADAGLQIERIEYPTATE